MTTPATPPPPLPWYRTPGRRLALLPLVLLGTPVVCRILVRLLPYEVLDRMFFAYRLAYLDQSLGLEGLALLAAALGVLTAGLAGLDRRGWLRPAVPLLPAALFAWFVATMVGLREAGIRDDTVRELARLFARDLGPEGTLAILAGLTLVGGAFALRLGQVTACPECGTWWGEPVSRSSGDSTETRGGHFHASGWAETRDVEHTVAESLVCRRCSHRWVRHYAVRTRYEKTGPLSGWTRRDH